MLCFRNSRKRENEFEGGKPPGICTDISRVCDCDYMPYFHFCLCQFSTDCNNAVNSNGYVMATARSENEM